MGDDAEIASEIAPCAASAAAASGWRNIGISAAAVTRRKHESAPPAWCGDCEIDLRSADSDESIEADRGDA